MLCMTMYDSTTWLHIFGWFLVKKHQHFQSIPPHYSDLNEWNWRKKARTIDHPSHPLPLRKRGSEFLLIQAAKETKYQS